jgi:HEAT repeat protein
MPPLRTLVLLLGTALAAGCWSRADLDSADPGRRAAAVRRLGGEAPDQALPALLVAQADRSVEVRLAAAEAFERLGGARAAEGLGALLADADPGVATAAARSLASLPATAGGKERLLAGYGQASSAGRAAIAAALLQIGATLREAVETEARLRYERTLAALERGSPAERAGAAEELGASGRPEAVTRLKALLAEGDRLEPALLAGVARGLGASGEREGRLRLERLLASQRPGVAEAAADGLRLLGDPGTADSLAGVAERGGTPGAAAMAALSALPKAPEVGGALCAVALRSADPARAAQAARLAKGRGASCPLKPLLSRLGRPGEQAALAALAELHWDGADAEAASRRLLGLLAGSGSEPAVRTAAARALGTIGWPGAAGELAERAVALSRRIDEARARLDADPRHPPAFLEPIEAAELGALLAAGGRLRADGLVPLVSRGLAEPAAAIRAGAVEAAGWLDGAASLPALEKGLGDPSPEVRAAAARALGRLGEGGAPALVRAASQTAPVDAAWRVELAAALAQTGSGEAVAGLARLLEGPSTGAAIQGLAQLGSSGGVKPLGELVERGEGPWLPDAIEALAVLGGTEAGAAIARQLTSELVEVREAAVRALGRLRHEPAAAGLEALKSDYVVRVRRAAIEALARLPSRRPGAKRP